MTVDMTTTAFDLFLIEKVIGQVARIEFDVTGPFTLITKHSTYSQLSVEAFITGSGYQMTVRYHICHPHNQACAQRLKLRPAEIDDELVETASHLSSIWPSYNQEYKDRFSINACLTTILLHKDATILRRLKNTIN